MEEEIITPEEETFDYHKLRYILNSDGYICHASIGALVVCDLGECTEYTGDIPEGYETIEEWYDEELERLNAWKIVEGNLVYDENKYNELQRQYEKESKENQCATHKYVNERLKIVSDICDEELALNTNVAETIEINNALNSVISKVKITPLEKTDGKLLIKSTNANMLENKAVANTINGVTFTINEDRSIEIDGTSTEDIELIINGSLENTSELFFIKKNIKYVQCGLAQNVAINLYSNDGTDIELVSSMGNGTINLNATKYITYVTLKIEKGKTFKELTVYPMLTIGEEKDYVPYQGSEAIIDLQEKSFMGVDYIEVEKENVTIYKCSCLYPSDDLFPSEDLYPSEDWETIHTDTTLLNTYENLTIVQCDKEVNMQATYFSNTSLIERVAKLEIGAEEIKAEVSKKVEQKEMEAAINIKANEITSKVSETYETKANATTNYSELKQTATSLQSQINSNNTNISKLNQTATNISSEVSKKVGNDEIISKINQSAETVTINANKVSLSGKTINLTSDNISMSSNCLSVDRYGRMQLRDSESAGSSLEITSSDNSSYHTGIYSTGALFEGPSGIIRIDADFGYAGGFIKVAPSESDSNYTSIQNGSVSAMTVTQRSKQSIKKNIEKYNENATDIVKNSEIYTYNFVSENDNDKKHIGFVIADNGGNYKTPEQVISKDREGISNYDMTSILWKAVQELQSEIENLKERLEEKENGKD